MILSKIVIENFKSIEKIDFKIKKYGNSYTTFFMGVNESGKSNILEAMSYLSTPTGIFDYNAIRNKKNKKGDPVRIQFYFLKEDGNNCFDEIKNYILKTAHIDCEIDGLVKTVSLLPKSENFKSNYEYKITEIPKNQFLKRIVHAKREPTSPNKLIRTISYYKRDIKEDKNFYEVTEALLKKHFNLEITDIIKKFEPKSVFWTPSEKYMIEPVNLNDFKKDIDSNIPLRNIFFISGYNDKKSINKAIDEIVDDEIRRELMTTLSDSVTAYTTKIWNHRIAFDVEVSSDGKCIVLIKDDGASNKNSFYRMTARSQGFKQFISLILSLSIESKELDKKNELILIDEPESHLNPSGIRDLRDELLAIGESNYLFVSTHSPFLVDKKNKERNIIIWKNMNAITEKSLIESEQDLRDDEVLNIAFGLNVYKDLFFPHKLLVEGTTDQTIIQKTLKAVKVDTCGVTSGTGSNIVKMAKLLNDIGAEVGVMVLVDDDADGQKYKSEIINLGNGYNVKNVFTLRDLVGDVKHHSTIEDMMSIEYLQSKFDEFHDVEFSELDRLVLNDQPFTQQVKKYLQKNNKTKKECEVLLGSIKKKVTDEFNPKQAAFERDFPMLKALGEKIKEKLV